MSKHTRFTFSTSARILPVILSSTSQSTCSIEAVIASMVLIARIMTIYSNTRVLFFMPTDLKFGTTVKYCQTFLSSPAFANSSRRMASDSRTASKRSLVIAPRQRTPRLTVNHIMRKAELHAAGAHFILKQLL